MISPVASSDLSRSPSLSTSLSSSSSASSATSSDSLAPSRRRRRTTSGAVASILAAGRKTLVCSSETSGYASASPSCLEALDYCHLSSASAYAREPRNRKRNWNEIDETSTTTATDYRHDSVSGCATTDQKSAHQIVASANKRHQTSTTSSNHLNLSSNFDRQQHHHLAAGLATSTPDPVYMDLDNLMHNLLAKERFEIERRKCATGLDAPISPLDDQTRHLLLSWMLKISEEQNCEDDVFSLATMILDKYLLFHPNFEGLPGSLLGGSKRGDCFEMDQLLLFAASSLLLAGKLRQTPQVSVQTLIDYSRPLCEPSIGLTREEILDFELGILATLKWDLAGLVTPNDFLELLIRKSQSVLTKFLGSFSLAKIASQKQQQREEDERALTTMQTVSTTSSTTTQASHQQSSGCFGIDMDVATKNKCPGGNKLANKARLSNDSANEEQNENASQLSQMTTAASGSSAGLRRCACECDQCRVRRHTQNLIELCLMDSKLSQYAPSILAMASMAVAINGLSASEKTCWRLNEIMAQIHVATNKVNKLEQMIDVAFQIEKYEQKLLNWAHDD